MEKLIEENSEKSLDNTPLKQHVNRQKNKHVASIKHQHQF